MKTDCSKYDETILKAKHELLNKMLNPELISKYGKTQQERIAINTYIRCFKATLPKPN